MRASQLHWSGPAGWMDENSHPQPVDLVLYFGTREALACGTRYRELRAMFPAAHVLGCSTGGQIRCTEVRDDEIAAVALRFDATRVKLVSHTVTEIGQSRSCIGRRLLLGQRITDEVEAAVNQLRAATHLGFFSYGEISPHAVSGCCELHNQTMTVTALREAA